MTYNIYSNSTRCNTERADCTVRAFAHCWDLNYDQAHEICKKAGRKDGSGFNINQLLKLNYNKKYRQFMNRGVSFHIRTHKQGGITVRRFIKEHPTGRYLCHVTGHAFALVDGVLRGQYKLGQIIKSYFYISDSFK